MHHDYSLIATIAVGLAFAFAGGFIAERLRLPPLVGYLLAGIAVGPFTPGFIADPKLATQLAEIGVILLMFEVGMHFSLRDLVTVQAVALPGALGQILVAAALAQIGEFSFILPAPASASAHSLRRVARFLDLAHEVAPQRIGGDQFQVTGLRHPAVAIDAPMAELHLQRRRCRVIA